MDERDWTELLRMLHGIGLRVVTADRGTLTICVQVPSTRETRDDAVLEWSTTTSAA